MTVRWTPEAAADLQQICDHIYRDDPAAALRVARSVYTRIGALQDHTLPGRAGRVQDTREFVLAPLPYIAVYEVAAEVVIVLRVLHGARQWP